jgi:hypothetical protein
LLIRSRVVIAALFPRLSENIRDKAKIINQAHLSNPLSLGDLPTAANII